MTKLRKRFWVYLAGMMVSILSAGYGFWSVRVFRIASHSATADLKSAPFYHPWPVWTGVSKMYIQHTGNWDPAASGHFIASCMLTMTYLGMLLFLLFAALVVFEFVRRSKISEDSGTQC